MREEEPIAWPNQYVANQLSEQIAATDLHELKGAVVGALYLVGQSEPTSLDAALATALNVNYWLQRQDGKAGDAPHVAKPDYVDKSLGRVADSIRPGVLRRGQARALFHLAEYKCLNGLSTDVGSVAKDFEKPFEVATSSYQSVMLGWTTAYYRSLLEQERVLTSAEFLAVQATRQVARDRARWFDKPSFYLEEIFSNRHYKKAIKRRVKLEKAMQEVVTHMALKPQSTE